ncbi:MAG: DUF1552 domain-containing protein [Gammaproteobacteria bacterium]|nr:DUF1552 domain-containing protein [Gammaproteobacteria bacterium]
MKDLEINRRLFLRASGVVLALPMLESMSFASAKPPARMVNICATLGLYADSWFPQTEGIAYEPSEYLKHIDAFRDSYTVFSGLGHQNQTGRQAHNSEITWLTSAEHPGLDGFVNTISLDQAAADHIGYVTRFPSLVLATNNPQSQSYTKGGVMVPAETSPSAMFTKLFLQGDPTTVTRETQRLTDGGSILDHLQSETASLLPQVSHSDRQKLDAYYEALRSAERELISVRAWHNQPKPAVNQESPVDIEDRADLVGRFRSMLNLIPLILETDSSRVVSLMIQDHGVVLNGFDAVVDQHNLSHHGQDESKIEHLRQVENAIVKTFGELLTSLSHRHDDGSSLLDSTTVLFGSNLGNANSHSALDLPILVAGGPFAHGQHIAYKGETNTPLSNLFVTLLRTIGLEIDAFGHSNEMLHWT